jgi:DNA gyrase subunit A
VGDDIVVGMEAVTPKDKLLVISSNGYGKLMTMGRYPGQNRGGMGVRAFRVTSKTGPLADARVVTVGVEDEVMLVSVKSKVYRTNLEAISTQGRNASGVIIWRPGGSDEVASIACFQNRPSQSSNGSG